MASTPATANAVTSSFVRKVRLQLPRLVGESTAFRALEHWLRARHHLSRKNVVRLEATLRQGQNVEDCYNLASLFLLAHQIQSEISTFLRFTAGENSRVAEIGTAVGESRMRCARRDQDRGSSGSD